jgi:hypothetical protein
MKEREIEVKRKEVMVEIVCQKCLEGDLGERG